MAKIEASLASGNSITPSNNSPTAMTVGETYEPTVNGYAIESYSSLAPSDSIPPTITSGTIYKASGNGKAIETWQNVSPSVKGNAFNAGFVRMDSGGYAHTDKQGFEEYYNNETFLTSSNSFKISMTGFQAGTKFLVLLFYHTSSSVTYNRLDGAAINDGTGTIRQLGNLKTSNATATGTFYEVVANSQAVSEGEVTIYAPSNCFCQVYVAG